MSKDKTRKTIGEQIDEYLAQGYRPCEVRDMGYSMSTIKYRRAKMMYPESYKNIIKRSVKNNKLYTARRRQSHSTVYNDNVNN